MAAGGQTGYLMASKMMAKHPCWGDWILPWITTLKGKWMEVMVVVQQMLLDVYIMVEPKYSEQPECWYAVLFTGPDCLPWALQSPQKSDATGMRREGLFFRYLVQDLSTYIWFYIKALWGVCVVNHEDLLWVVRAASGLLSGAEICTHGWVELLPLCWLRGPGLMSDVEAEHTVYPAVIKKHLLIPGCVPP